MSDKERYCKLDELHVIGVQEKDSKHSKQYHALKTSAFFKALKSCNLKGEQGFRQLDVQRASGEKI